MVGCCPVTQTLQNHLLHHRVVTVHGIAAAAEIIIKALRRQHIVNIVVKALEGKTGTKLIPLCCMIEYYVQNTFNPVCI